VSTRGPTAESTTETGRTITCTGLESTLGVTEGSMMVITSTTRSMDLASTPGPMEDNIMACGSTANNMVKECILCQRERLEEVDGKKVTESSGSMPNRKNEEIVNKLFYLQLND
jgi:hypothetical protein